MERVIYKTALDIGSSKIKAVTGELSEDGKKIRIIASTEVNSSGMKKAKIVDSEKLSECIKEAIIKLEKLTELKIEEVSIGISGKHIKSETKPAKHHFLGGDVEIKEDHYDLLFDSIEKKVSQDNSIIKKELYNLRVNDSGIIKNPIGMTGEYLSGDVHLITADKSQLETLVETVNKANLKVENITLNAYASAKATLTREDKKMGVALVDIGEGSTDLIIFKSEKMIYSKSIPIGGMHYINDLAYMERISREDAKKVIELYHQSNDEDLRVSIDNEHKNYKASMIKDLFIARSGDIIKYLESSIQESGFNGYLGNGIILTGGAIKIKGLEEQLAKNLNHRVTKGKITKLKGFGSEDLAYSTSVGIFLESMEKEHEKLMEAKKSKEPELKKEAIEVAEKQEIKEENTENKNEKEEKKPSIFSKAKNLFGEFF